MKKSVQVPASLIAAIAATITAQGCGSGSRCVDAAGNVLPDSACRGNTVPGAHWVSRGGFGTSGSTGSSFGG